MVQTVASYRTFDGFALLIDDIFDREASNVFCEMESWMIVLALRYRHSEVLVITEKHAWRKTMYNSNSTLVEQTLRERPVFQDFTVKWSCYMAPVYLEIIDFMSQCSILLVFNNLLAQMRARRRSPNIINFRNCCSCCLRELLTSVSTS